MQKGQDGKSDEKEKPSKHGWKVDKELCFVREFSLRVVKFLGVEKIVDVSRCARVFLGTSDFRWSTVWYIFFRLGIGFSVVLTFGESLCCGFQMLLAWTIAFGPWFFALLEFELSLVRFSHSCWVNSCFCTAESSILHLTSPKVHHEKHQVTSTASYW